LGKNRWRYREDLSMFIKHLLDCTFSNGGEFVQVC
jgi:hypothetical protein